MANDNGIEPKYLWIFFKNFQESGFKQGVDELSKQVQIVLPTLPLSGVREWIQDAPQKAQEALWNLWAGGAYLSGMSLRAVRKNTEDLLPSIMVIVWSAWARQADLSMYTRGEWVNGTEKLPTVVREELGRILYSKFPQIAPTRIITGQLNGRR